MKQDYQNEFSRRGFLKASLIGAAGLTLLPGLHSCATAPSDKIRLGFIGLGQQAMSLLRGFIGLPDVQVVAGCDVYEIKRLRFEKRVNEYYAKAEMPFKAETCENYQDILSRKDIDAVVIATPDHWHALIAIDACKAGKDIYIEKPLTFTIKEGQAVVKAVRENNRIMQVGSQQRSDHIFQHAVQLVQNGTLGKISKINAYVGAPPTPLNLPEEPLPAGLNWKLWLGPLNKDYPYNHELNPPISLDPEQNEKLWGAWRWYKEMGGGFTTDWGAHMFDIAQWALNKDGSGPVEIIPAGYQDYKYLTYVYDNGTIMTEEPYDEKMTKGCKFIGENGWIEVTRGAFKASDESWNPAPVERPGDDMPYETRVPHQARFIEAVKTRIDPNVTVEIAHSSCTVCTLGNISYELGRPVKWNPSTQTFVDDKEADNLMHYTYREGYSL